MKTDTFISRFRNKAIQDDGVYPSKEFKSFATCFKNYLKRLFPDAEIVNFNKGHYDVSAFVRFPNDKFVYVSYSVPRYGRRIDVTRSDASEGVLYRTAEHEHDYRGGSNNFTSLERLADIQRLAR